ncbi:MAG: dienelactone hydrolase family protein [Azospirillaceae bacterium]
MAIRETIRITPHHLPGVLSVPDSARGLVVFAHGSGSSHASPRNTRVADGLNRAGLATLLFDLLTEAEAQDRRNVFDVELLADRLEAASDVLAEMPAAAGLAVGCFGASTGAAAALIAAARRPEIAAVVSRGGRPDMAAGWLAAVRAPTLLIVGENDTEVLALNRDALERLTGPKALAVVPGATHLFEEPGAFDRVVDHARDWFLRHLAPTHEG